VLDLLGPIALILSTPPSPFYTVAGFPGLGMENAKKRLLLIDENDTRRASRIRLLTSAGYSIDVRDDYIEAERLDHERDFDVILLALHGDAHKAIAYSDHLSKDTPRQPILLLTDYGVYVPPGTLSRSVESGDPGALILSLPRCLLAAHTSVSFRSLSNRLLSLQQPRHR
jgi:AmiR/NasT family two-component response regulator